MTRRENVSYCQKVIIMGEFTVKGGRGRGRGREREREREHVS